MSLEQKLLELESCKYLLNKTEYENTRKAILNNFSGGKLKIALCFYHMH
jgi:hypothetical protein